MTALAPERAPQAPVMRALKEALITALLGAALFLPMIGFTTVQSMQNILVLETRWSLFFIIVAIVTGLRFVQVLFLLPWLEQRPSKPAATSTPLAHWRTRLKKWFTPVSLALIAVYPPLVIFLTGWSGAL